MTYVPRVNKLDALQLDKAIDDILREQQLKIKDGKFNHLILYQRELDVILNSFLWIYSFRKYKASLGQQLLALEYDEKQMTTWTLVQHYLLSVLLPRLYRARLETGIETSKKYDKILFWSENFYLILKLWIFFRFCIDGKRPTLTDNLLGIDLHSTEIKRTVSYGYMNRELLWNGFIEFLVYTIPMINFQLIRNRLRQFLSKGNRDGVEVIPHLTQTTCCVFCTERPTLPHHIGCGHIYCYYCIAGNKLSDSKFTCVECGRLALDVRPVQSK